MTQGYLGIPIIRWVLLLVAVVLAATLAFAIAEGLDPLTSLYFVLITITTVGFGDITPHTQAGRLLTMALVPVGITLVFGLGFSLIQQRLDDIIRRGGLDPMKEELSRVDRHYIVCGYGNMGRHTASILRTMEKTVVVIDQDPELRYKLESAGILHVADDALEEDTLTTAGINRCRALITTFNDDTRNVYLVLEARELAPGLDIVSTASTREAARRLRLAGASRIVAPTAVGGELLAKSAVSPLICQMMSDIVSGTADTNITQVIIDPESPLAGHRLNELPDLCCEIRVLLAKSGDEITLSPDSDHVLAPDTLLVVLGPGEQIKQLEQLAHG